LKDPFYSQNRFLEYPVQDLPPQDLELPAFLENFEYLEYLENFEDLEDPYYLMLDMRIKMLAFLLELTYDGDNQEITARPISDLP
jgi:hypothetical protein